MRRPTWLQDLRDLLALPTYEARQAAMQDWETRWLLDLHAVLVVTPEEQTSARVNALSMAADHVREMIVGRMAELMVDVTIEACDGGCEWLAGNTFVRGEVLAMRREPKTDD